MVTNGYKHPSVWKYLFILSGSHGGWSQQNLSQYICECITRPPSIVISLYMLNKGQRGFQRMQGRFCISHPSPNPLLPFCLVLMGHCLGQEKLLSSQEYDQTTSSSDDQAVTNIVMDAFASNLLMLPYWPICTHWANSLQMLQKILATIFPGNG